MPDVFTLYVHFSIHGIDSGGGPFGVGTSAVEQGETRWRKDSFDEHHGVHNISHTEIDMDPLERRREDPEEGDTALYSRCPSGVLYI